MKFKSLYFLVLLIVVFNRIPLSAQNIFSKKFSIDNGLLSTDNYRVYQDFENYIWVCSERGISKFDGYNFTYFTTNEGLVTNDVWEILIDSKNRKWLRYFGNGIQYIENDNVKTIKGSEKLGQFYYVGEHSDTAFFILEDTKKTKSERYFLAPNNSFGKYAPNIFKDYNLRYDFREQDFKIFTGQRNNNQISYCLSDRNNSSISTLGFNSVEGGYVRENESLVLYEKNYVYFKNGKPIKFDISRITQSKIIQVNYDPSSGYLFLKTDAFHYVFKNHLTLERDQRIELILNQSEDLAEKKIAHILLDNERNLWVTESRGEVYFFPFNSVWYNYIIVENISGNAIYPTTSRDLSYFVYRPNLLYKYDNTKKVTAIRADVLSLRQIEKYKNELLVLTTDDLYKIKQGENKIEKKNGFNLASGNSLRSIYFLNNEDLVFNSGDVFSLKKNKIVDKFNFPPTTSRLLIKDSIIFCANDHVLKIMNLKTNKSRQIQLKSIHILKKIDNYLVVGYDNSLAFYSLDYNLTKKSIINFEFHVNDIFLKDNLLYVATDEGLFYAKLDKLKVGIPLKILLKSRFYGFQINNLRVTDKFITLFTTKGVVEFDKRDLMDFSVQKKIKYNYTVLVNDKEIGSKNNFILKSDQNTIKFKLKSISFFNLGELVYRYKLVGLDSNYSYITDPSITFSNLKPGKYKLYVAISTSKSLDFQSKKTIEFEILSPFYSSVWFIGIVIFVIVAIIWLIVFLTRRIIQRRETRKLKLKDLELRALRAQLNPHFVFNSLNTIQSMLFLKSPQEANVYITSFADLIRSVLDSSRMDKITLKEEVKFLEGYLSLEQRRLKNTLNYSITFDRHVDLAKIKVYTLVFQPFIENAIVHAFKNGQQMKTLNIHFYLKNNILIATIEDNGIGIKNSMQLNKSKIHISHASTILKEKAQLLNSIRKDELLIEVQDLMETEFRPGTRVIVKMRV